MRIAFFWWVVKFRTGQRASGMTEYRFLRTMLVMRDSICA
jgi:hypothetical protein